MQRAKPQRDPVIETKRLTLRLPDLRDLDDLVAEVNNYDVAKMTARIPYPYGTADGAAFLTAVAERAAAGRSADFSVFRHGRLIGGCGLFGLPYKPELGYWFGRAHWGKGYATEAAAAIAAYGFEVLRLPLIRAGVFADNPASWRVQEKLGFRRVNVRRARSLARGGEVEHIDAVLIPARFHARRAA